MRFLKGRQKKFGLDEMGYLGGQKKIFERMRGQNDTLGRTRFEFLKDEITFFEGLKLHIFEVTIS